MHRTQYLNSVNDFIDWFASNLGHASLFAHSYIDRRSNPAAPRTLAFTTLFDACKQYHWKHNGAFGSPAGACLQTNDAALSALRQALQSAINTVNDSKTLTASSAVMSWGGVRAGNVRWLTANSKGLAQTIASVCAALDSDNLSHPVLTSCQPLRFNAGMTKVYSLLVNDFIIYDSRVAAALGWIVVKYCQARKLPAVPRDLAFPWAPAKEAANARLPKNRDPGLGNYHFPRLISGELHAVWNLKAGWILAEVLARASHNPFRNSSTVPALRQLEAALFMVGYDLPLNVSPSGVNSEPESYAEGDWTECYTAARGKLFHYRVEEGGIRLLDGRFYPVAVINRMLIILVELFGTDPFPLANSATKVRVTPSIPGIGYAYFQATDERGNPPSASALAAVLHELGVLNYTPDNRAPWALDFGDYVQRGRIDLEALLKLESERHDDVGELIA
ncbi:hypothetical protein [Pseudomonas sp. HS6]|uniref:hypothetical protein n=1 Tax=Pseudomonas sp. HS6 TaxID=2850559 RepID=UPI00201A0F3F|nr:hypothetical protein [Pseudomonas sp. HS6]UQS16697.1 hypothetical protein JJN09_07535 [Pseudomonas sp. HS6]